MRFISAIVNLYKIYSRFQGLEPIHLFQTLEIAPAQALTYATFMLKFTPF